MNNPPIKLKTQVQFTDNLSINVVSMENEEEKHSSVIKFQLVAFVKHIGSQATSGHYVAILKTDLSWELHDDDTISNLHHNSVFSEHSFENVYLLTYIRVE